MILAVAAHTRHLGEKRVIKYLCKKTERERESLFSSTTFLFIEEEIERERERESERVITLIRHINKKRAI
jgi:hypothetical protein